MNPPLQNIRLSKQEVDILNAIKRKTKINQWNVLCRMAFCLSCADLTVPTRTVGIKSDSSVEIDWATFGGDEKEIYSALAIFHRYKMKNDDPIGEYFRRLLYRGIFKLKDQINME